MSLNDDITHALTAYLQQYEPWMNVDYVISWWDVTIHGGYCETCAYTTAGIKIQYMDTNGVSKTYEIEEPFSQLINRL